MVDQEFGSRLRRLRDAQGLTVQKMADKTGVPKRTLDKYMLREEPVQPGLDAIVRIATGLGVSTDWLLFGSETAAEDVARIARMSARAAALPFIQHILILHNTEGASAISGDKILGLTAEELAAEIGASAGERARGVVAAGASRQTIGLGERTLNARFPTDDK